MATRMLARNFRSFPSQRDEMRAFVTKSEQAGSISPAAQATSHCREVVELPMIYSRPAAFASVASLDTEELL